MEIPSFSTYGDYSPGRGLNALRMDFADITLYYSYRTVVAFHTWSGGLKISENVWGVTTGKHLNWINPDKSIRLPNDEFEKLLEEEIRKRSEAHKAMNELLPVLKSFLNREAGSMGKLKILARKLISK